MEYIDLFLLFDSHSTSKFVFPPKPSRRNTFGLLIISKGQLVNVLDGKFSSLSRKP